MKRKQRDFPNVIYSNGFLPKYKIECIFMDPLSTVNKQKKGQQGRNTFA